VTTYAYAGGALTRIASARHHAGDAEYATSGTLSAVVRTDGAATDYRIDDPGRLLAASVPPGDSTVVDFDTGVVRQP
jgi:hypothetical protein